MQSSTSLRQRATTAQPSPCLDQDRNNCQDEPPPPLYSPEWLKLFEEHYHGWLQLRVADYKPGRWLFDRVKMAAVPRVERHRLCGRRKLTVKCGCRVLPLPVECGDRWLCRGCAERYAKRTRRRLLKAMTAQPAKRGHKWRLITLTLDHSGTVVDRVAFLKKAWARLRIWMHSVLGKFSYACVLEMTPGRDSQGHPHLHVAAFLPYIDYGRLHRAWLRATRGRSNHVDVQTMRKAAKGAASYLAKYIGKRGEGIADMPAYLAAEVTAALWQRRSVTCSRGFWVPKDPCPTCAEWFELVEAPRALQDYSMLVAGVRALGGRAPPAQSRWC